MQFLAHRRDTKWSPEGLVREVGQRGWTEGLAERGRQRGVVRVGLSEGFVREVH